MYDLIATNVGGARTTGEFTVRAELPDGISLSTDPENKSVMISGRQYHNFTAPCEASGNVVTCTGGGDVDDYIPSGEHLNVTIYVDVAADAPAFPLSTFTVEGGGATAPVSREVSNEITSALPSFGFSLGSAALSGVATSPGGTVVTQAGSHPGIYEAISAKVNHTVIDGIMYSSGGGLRDVLTELPKGMVINPQATAQCSEEQLESEGCPRDSQVGTITIPISFGARFGAGPTPLFNMVPPAGVPAALGFEFPTPGIYFHILGGVKTGGSYALFAKTADITAQVATAGIQVDLWGDPTAESHDELRSPCDYRPNDLCPAEERRHTAFVTMPSSCGAPTVTTVEMDGWEQPDEFVEGSFESRDFDGSPVSVEGCNRLEFEPTISSQATTNLADAPSGLDFDLHIPQNQNFEALSPAHLKDASVTLPEGMTVNPSSADGLGGCTAAEIDINGPDAAACPDKAKLGSAEIITPLLKEPLPGQVYLASPFDNPFGSLLAIYIAVADPRTGVVIKLAGEVRPDPATGRLTTVFKDNPELPFDDLKLSLFNGPRAPLKTPAVCGTSTTISDLTPWSTPEGADATPSDTFATTVAQDGGVCPTSEAELPNELGFDAGTIAPKAGAFSPFVLKVTRPDGSQRITAIDTTLPPGLTGKLAGVPYCSEAQIAAAAARANPDEGAAERAAPSCPAASEVGTVNVGAGAGPNPVYVGGHAYLAGPYKGAPLSLVVITPAIAGPFDLGTVVTRIALHVNPETAQIHAVSDPLPTILQGIPLDVRSIALKMDRQEFTLNPTSCDPMAVAAAVTSSAGHQSSLSSRFQVGSCSALAFKPKLWLKLKGGTKRTKHPSLTAIVTQPPGQANIGQVSVTLPHSAFLEQAHIRTICTRVQFAEGAVPGERCPPGSIYGKAKAFTPLLDKPISGPVFLRSSSHALPDLVAALHGQVDVVLAGRVDAVHGRLRNTFEAVPDAPVSKFILQMRGGKRGLVVNSTDLCKTENRAVLKMRGQNGKELEARPLVRNSCKDKHRKRKR
jgi:hypothetical protein